MAKALASAHRLDLLELLAQGERSVDGLASTTGMSIANTSQHLQVLRRVGLVVSRKSGPHVLYRLSDDDVLSLLASLRQTAERHVAEVDRLVRGYFHEKDALEAVSRDDLVARLGELPEGMEVVAYCRGPYCVLAYEAVAALRERAARRGAWRTVSPNGGRRDCRWRPKAPRATKKGGEPCGRRLSCALERYFFR